MQPLRIMTLDLRAPLSYRSTSRSRTFLPPETGERVARFDLASSLASAVENEGASFLGEPTVVAESAEVAGPEGEEVVIPAGRYLFAQFRAESLPVEAELLAEAAIEVQKDGLWRGVPMEPWVYLRFLSEEGGLACQVLRPIADSGD